MRQARPRQPFVFEDHNPVVGPHPASRDLEQRRFSGPVSSQQRRDAARRRPQRRRREHWPLPEALADGLGTEDGAGDHARKRMVSSQLRGGTAAARASTQTGMPRLARKTCSLRRLPSQVVRPTVSATTKPAAGSAGTVSPKSRKAAPRTPSHTRIERTRICRRNGTGIDGRGGNLAGTAASFAGEPQIDNSDDRAARPRLTGSRVLVVRPRPRRRRPVRLEGTDPNLVLYAGDGPVVGGCAGRRCRHGGPAGWGGRARGGGS